MKEEIGCRWNEEKEEKSVRIRKGNTGIGREQRPLIPSYSNHEDKTKMNCFTCASDGCVLCVLPWENCVLK